MAKRVIHLQTDPVRFTLFFNNNKIYLSLVKLPTGRHQKTPPIKKYI